MKKKKKKQKGRRRRSQLNTRKLHQQMLGGSCPKAERFARISRFGWLPRYLVVRVAKLYLTSRILLLYQLQMGADLECTNVTAITSFADVIGD